MTSSVTASSPLRSAVHTVVCVDADERAEPASAHTAPAASTVTNFLTLVLLQVAGELSGEFVIAGGSGSLAALLPSTMT